MDSDWEPGSGCRRLRAVSDNEIQTGGYMSDLKRKIKNMLPWRVRYQLGILGAKYPGFIPQFLKQHSNLKDYNSTLYHMLERIHCKNLEGKVICEMGCGQFFSHAPICYQLGARELFLLEIKDFADSQHFVKEEELKLEPRYTALRTLPAHEHIRWTDYLPRIQTKYFFDGLRGYEQIPDNYIDFCFSCTVLQHIRKNVFEKIVSESYRFMKKGGFMIHQADLRDCFGGRKNQLRFSEEEWENDVHYRMDNYTNRLSCSQMLAVFERNGFRIADVKKRYFKKCPIKRNQLAKEFQMISEEELMIRGFVVLLKKE